MSNAEHLFIDKLTMLRISANPYMYGSDGLFDILFCKKDGTLCQLKGVARFVKNATPRKLKTTRLATNYNKTETILFSDPQRKYHKTVPISAILKFNNRWLTH